MKKVHSTIFLLLLSLIGVAQDVTVTYCRPVKAEFDSVMASIKDKDSVQIRIFKDEWFETFAINNADAKIKIDTDKWLKTDGKDSKSTMLDADRKDSLSNHKPLKIRCCKTKDSLYIYIPSVDDSKWFYVINQGENKKVSIEDSTSYGKWLAYPIDSLTNTFRISPENHVVSVIKIHDIKEAEEKTITEGNNSYKCLIFENNTIRRERPDGVPSKSNSLIYIVIAIVIVLLGTLFLCQRMKGCKWIVNRLLSNNKIKGEEFDPKTQQKVVFLCKTCVPENEKDEDSFEYAYYLPDSPQKGKKYYLNTKGNHTFYFVAEEFVISKNWKEITKDFNDTIQVSMSFNNPSELPSDPQDGMIIQISPCSDPFFNKSIRYFKYEEDIEVEEHNLNGVCKNFSDLLNQLLPEVSTELKDKILSRYDYELQSQTNDYKELKQQNEDLIKKQREQENEIDKTKKDLIAAEVKYSRLKENFDKQVKEKVEKIERDAAKKIEKAENQREQAISEKNKIREQLNAAFEKTRSALEEAKQKAENKFEQSDAELKITKANLKKTIEDLNTSQRIIRMHEEAQKKFTTVLTYVPFAEEYTLKVKNLHDVVNQICQSATKLLEIETIQDPYHIMKCLAKYTKSITGIDLPQFYTDVKMITKGQMVLKDTTLSTYNQESSREQLYNSLKIYFFDTYLSKYIESAVVLNESCIGLDRLVNGLQESDVKIFKAYREELQKCVEQLEIEVKTVHLFDKVGQKIDLRVTLVDAGFSTGDILEIENCFVFLKGGRQPDTKIFVKAQS